ncbi:MAG: N-acetyltransferase [Nitrospirota bacterium]
MIQVIEVQKENLGDFIKLPFILYSKDPNFIPQLNREMQMHFSDKNPFFRHAGAKYYIALKEGKISGRIISFVNRRHNEFQNERTGFFGFFDCINDISVADALFEKAAGYLKKEGMEIMRGPMNFSTNEECGFLIEGFSEPPMLMTPYNPFYYNNLSVECGMKKIKDLYAYIYETQNELPEKIKRVAAITDKKGITVRPINMNNFMSEMMIFKEVYNSAWHKNWGFIPMTDEELIYAGKRLKQIIVPDLTLIAEKGKEPIGFLGMVPDFNLVLKKMNGKLNPASVAKALYYSRKIRDLRLMLLGIKKEYRNTGIEALLFREGFKPIKKGRYKRVEFSWILEDNIPVQRIIEMVGGRLYKKYRIYEKAI